MTDQDAVLTERLVRFRPRLFVASLLAALLAAVFVYSWGYQIRNDIGVSGINRPVFWGFYITNIAQYEGREPRLVNEDIREL